MNLVPNWKQAPRWISMWCMSINGAMALTWLALPKEYQEKIPPDYILIGVLAFVITGIIGRMFQQSQVTNLPEQTQQSIADLKATAADLKDSSKAVSTATATIESAAADQASGS